MKAGVWLILTALMLATAMTIAVLHSRSRSSGPPTPEPSVASSPNTPATEPPSAKTGLVPRSSPQQRGQTDFTAAPAEEPRLIQSKLERLEQIRRSFRVLAPGDARVALRAAKQISNEVEREAALTTLVTEWTKGELSSPRQRAGAISVYGLEAGLGFELVSNPALAILYANELTDGAGRAAIMERVAMNLADTPPASALALSDQLPADEKQRFLDSFYSGWAYKDTDAAIRWAEQLPTPEQRESAMASIRSVAPVGIGAALTMQDGYPVVNQLMPGAPAELSGQIHPGDRILALAQAGDFFVDTHSLSLSDIIQMVRGAPGTQIQLQVVAGDAPPNSPPRTVSIVRDQVKFKR